MKYKKPQLFGLSSMGSAVMGGKPCSSGSAAGTGSCTTGTVADACENGTSPATCSAGTVLGGGACSSFGALATGGGCTTGDGAGAGGCDFGSLGV